MIVTQQLGPWSKGCLSVFIKHSFVNEYTMYLSKFNYNVIFAASTLFHFVLFWYIQPTKFPQAQFKKTYDLLTSKGHVQYLFLEAPLA